MTNFPLKFKTKSVKRMYYKMLLIENWKLDTRAEICKFAMRGSDLFVIITWNAAFHFTIVQCFGSHEFITFELLGTGAAPFFLSHLIMHYDFSYFVPHLLLTHE